MTVALYFLVPIAIAATLIVLVVGISGLVRGGKFNRRFGNKLMQVRVVFQFFAVVFLVLLALASGG